MYKAADAERRLHADGVRRPRAGALLSQDAGGGDPIMLHVHQNGVGVCGVFTYEVAETKVTQVMDSPASTSIRCNARWKRNSPKCPFSRNLEQTLHRALALANERKHEYATLEHLLLALTDDDDASAVMRACKRRSRASCAATSLELSRQRTRRLVVNRGWRTPSRPPASSASCSAPCHPCAVVGREEVTGANVLVAIFAERESHAAYFLQEQDMTRSTRSTTSATASPSAGREVEARARARRRRGEGRREPSRAARRSRLLREPQQEGPRTARSIR
jgi:hypothetical protein